MIGGNILSLTGSLILRTNYDNEADLTGAGNRADNKWSDNY